MGGVYKHVLVTHFNSTYGSEINLALAKHYIILVICDLARFNAVYEDF